MVEDVQNKVRNKLVSIQALYDVCKAIIDCDNTKQELTNIIINPNFLSTVKESINDLIAIAAECDKKINDPNYDVWNEVLKNKKNINNC